MIKPRGWWAATACAALLAGSVAAGCGGDDGGGAEERAAGAKPGLTPVEIGILGISADAPIWIGIEQGYFKEEGIEVRTQVSGAGGSAFVPALLGGDLDVGAGGADGAIQAMAKGLDVQILAHEGAPVSHGHTAASAEDTEHITLAVMSKKGSDVRSIEDLEGETVAAITVSGLQYLCVQRAMEIAGADPKTVKVLETPLPDMIPAMETDRVGAAVLLEPFVTQAKGSGANVVSYACEEAIPGVIQGAYFVSGEWARENPEAAAGLARALVRANRYAEEHPEEQRRVIAENTKIPPEAAEKMALYPFPAPEDRPRPNTLDAIAELMVRYGHIEEVPDLEAGLTG